MKVEKINKNKAVILITSKELDSKKISLKDIKEGSKKARNFFFQILEDSMIYENLEIEASKLLIEVSQTNDDLFKITITAADCIPDVDLVSKFRKAKNVVYTVSSNLYRFDSFKDLYAFILIVLKENLYVGNNSLYIMDDQYYLHFSVPTVSNPSFVETFGVISEYSSKYYSKKSISFFEHALLLIKNSAIQILSKI